MKNFILFLVLLFISSINLAQSDSFRGFLTYNKAESAGFEEGIGFIIDGKFKITPSFRFLGSTSLSSEQKFSSEDGFSFNTSLGLGLDIFDSFVPYVGVSFGGYDARFINGDVWQKVGLSPEVGILFSGRRNYEVDFSYSFARDDNLATKAYNIKGIFDYPNGFSFISSFSYFDLSSEFDELSGLTGTIGLGYNFSKEK